MSNLTSSIFKTLLTIVLLYVIILYIEETK